MTQDEIIEMADKADAEADNVLNMKGEYHPNWHQVRDGIFAKLVRDDYSNKHAQLWLKRIDEAVKAEREACARLSITIPNPYKDCQISAHGYDMGILEYSRAIRARGEA